MDRSGWSHPKRDARHPIWALQHRITAILEQESKETIQVMERMMEYVCFPLIHMFKSESSSAASIELATPLYPEFLFILPLIAKQGKAIRLAPNARPCPPSEEIQLKCILALSFLVGCLRNTPNSVVRDTPDSVFQDPQPQPCHPTSPPLLPIIAHAVTVLLDIIHLQSLLELRLAASQVLIHLVSVLKQRSILVQFLPGISSTLCKTLLKDVKTHHSLMTQCLTILMLLYGRCLQDTEFPHLSSATIDSSQLALQILQTVQPSPQQPTQNQVWLTSTRPRIKESLLALFSLRTHSHPQIRRHLVEFAFTLSTRCAASLQDTLTVVWENLAYFSVDENEDVAVYARQCIQSISDNKDMKHQHSSTIRHNLYQLMQGFPRLSKATDTKKLEIVSIATGYLLLVKSDISITLNTGLTLLSHGLLTLLEFDHSDIKMVQDTWKGDASDLQGQALIATHNPSHVFHRFKHFHHARLGARVIQFIRLLGFYGNISVLMDRFSVCVEDVVQDTHCSALFLMNQLILGSVGMGISDLIDPLTQTTSPLVPSTMMKMTRSYLDWLSHSTPTGRMNVTLKGQDPCDYHVMNKSILSTSLLLEGIAHLSSVLSNQFHPFLMDCLYLILEQVGDTHRWIQHVAMSTLRTIAISLGDTSEDIPSLIMNNIDYIVNQTALKFRYLEQYPRAPLVLKAAIQVAGSQVVPFLSDLVEMVLVKMDIYHATHPLLVEMMMQLLLCTTHALRSTLPSPLAPTEPVSSSQVSSKVEKVVEQFKRRQAEKTRDLETRATMQEIKEFFTQQNEQRQQPEKEAVPSDEPEERGLTREEKMVVEMCSKMQHYLGHEAPSIRLLALKNIQQCVECLPGKELQKDLFPLIHKVWPGIVQRLTDQQHYVRTESIHTLVVISQYAHDFISKRVIDDIWPKLKHLATELQHVGREETIHNYASVHQKARLTFLDGLSHLVRHVILRNDELQTAETMILPFLNKKRFGEQIQVRAVSVMKALAALDPDGVWLNLFILVQGSKEIMQMTKSNGPLHLPLAYVARSQSLGRVHDFIESVEMILPLL